MENGANTFHTTPQSFRLAYKPKIQLPLHRGAEKRYGNPRCGFFTGEPGTRRPLNGRGRRLAGKSENFLKRKKLNRKSTTYVLCLCSDEEQERFLLSNYQRHRAGIAAGLCAKPSLAAAKGVFLKIQNSFKKTHGSSFAFRRRKPWAAQTGSTRRRKPPAFFRNSPQPTLFLGFDLRKNGGAFFAGRRLLIFCFVRTLLSVAKAHGFPLLPVGGLRLCRPRLNKD